MSYKNTIKCGPNVTDNFNDWIRINNTSNDYRYHSIIGFGVISSCEAMETYPSYDDRYSSIDDRIIEFADNCFNKESVSVVSIPSQLKKIGNHCFEKSNITSLTLPDTLEEIGHNNFPKTLNAITIPPLIKDFPVDNLLLCDKITEIQLHKDNTAYKVIDGILYNNDITEILYCPNGKVGKVIIPDTVRKIGNYCFYDNKKLTSIIIPTSVVSIGDYAFSGVYIDKLIIPNSVLNLGESCFSCVKVKSLFKFPKGVTTLPNDCFYLAELPLIDFLERITSIGDGAFDVRGVDESLPKIVSLKYVETIGVEAFYDEKATDVFELFSCLKDIAQRAFVDTSDTQIIKFFSFAPIKLNIDAFKGMSENSILMIPKGTKCIYENAIPWSLFNNIIEMNLESNIVDDKEELVSVDEYKFRLESVANSIYKADREYLKNIIQDLSYNYLNVSTDEEYDEALSLIAYNNRFNPPIIPYLETAICESWESKYRLRILGKSVLEYGNVPSLDNFITNDKVHNDISSIPLLNIETLCLESKLLPIKNRIVVESYFGDILSKIQSELFDAGRSIRIAVSWFTNYALFKTVNELADKGVDVEIVINNDLINNGGYCLNFNELISKESVRFYLVEYPHLLHHKFCIIDDKTVINGSYNWTRFSGSNYENIMIIRNDVNIISAFNDEFERILQQAEHKDIDKMPDNVPERPEYDRSAFKQYITEELDKAAHEVSDERDKITVLHRASRLNPEYFRKINPNADIDYEHNFDLLDGRDDAISDVIDIIESSDGIGNNHEDSATEVETKVQNKSVDSTNKSNIKVYHAVANSKGVSAFELPRNEKIEKIKASSLFFVLDVSGSMKSLYTAGHVHNISKKVLSASLAVSNSKEYSLWKFGNKSEFVGMVGLQNIDVIKNVQCEGSGTNLNSFVKKADNSILDNSLVIIFTDDDLKSIQNSIQYMKNRENVFWQVIVYGSHNNISSTITDIPNVSLVCMDNYKSKSQTEINNALLKDYIIWKNKRI